MCGHKFNFLELPFATPCGRNEVDTLLYPHKVPQNQRDRPEAALWLVGRHVSSLGSSGNCSLAVEPSEFLGLPSPVSPMVFACTTRLKFKTSFRSVRASSAEASALSLSRFSVSVASDNSQAKNIIITTPGTHPRESRFGGRTVTFRSLRTDDKELFKTFIRSLPRKDNYYLMVDVYDDQAINRWMNRVESGEIIGVIALEGNQMIGY